MTGGATSTTDPDATPPIAADLDADPGSRTRIDPGPWTAPNPSGLPWASGVTVAANDGRTARGQIEAFEKFRGRPIDIYTAFTNRQGTFEQLVNGFFWSNGLPELLARRQVLVVLTVPPVVQRYADNPRGNLGIRRAAAGEYDRFHVQIARRIRDAGWRRPVVIRLGQEPSDPNRAYSYALDEAAGYANYKAMFARLAGIYRSVIDPRGRGDCLINWCNLRRPTSDPRPAYPGNRAVDIVGLDIYGNAKDIDYPPDRATFEEQYLNRRGPGGTPFSVGAFQTFARNHGKPIAIDESGVTNPQGPNRPADWGRWVQGMARFYPENRGAGPGQLLYEVYFNRIFRYDEANGSHVIVPSDINPAAAARYAAIYRPDSQVAQADD